MVKIKSGRYGARLSEIQAICVMMIIVDQVLTEAGIDYEITSGIEGKHQTGSLHYPGHALDFALRGRVSFVQGDMARQSIKFRLGDDFDVIFTRTKRVIHVEWQMKKPLGKL